ncbi:tRNA dimethylallyltransferase [Dysgonomonas sp. PH5-45]|uniref:tRNA (adenosine(37)-N6)-dimethylallyltransferase MiaA n=1 Tax=unclassified Dysgonomonas TaxID=2630389 RepID=UPI002472F1C7|nr:MULTISPECIES: tRNA (adenosine(37)-N6)-dimethylallyltransferase MiaA [unclassified Dysgonomonas]MDH6355285.1 tRNA dimethylallyltransferase [Dysgonomonas sp. PH5-45]MDH6388189.1 tRNA dimethylallyltransferase [Dysgonomonas sp. PH5-37]
MKKLIVLLGPTGVGKTDLSLNLAEYYRCPVISADSRQFYKGLEIGTAAPTPEQLRKVKHHFVGSLSVDDYYSASEFEAEAIRLIEELHRQHSHLVLAGGSMMYVDALCKGIDDIPTIDESLRKDLYEQYENKGLEHIRQQLKTLDPAFYAQVDLKNHKRVIHALEVCLMTGKPYSSFRTNSVKERPFRIIRIGLTRNREELYGRINRRVDQMMQDGLLDEAKSHLPNKHLNSLNTVGYKELFKYLEGEWELDFAIEKIKRNTRVYARKQLTWFKRDESIHWFNLSELTEEQVLKQIIGIADSPI